MFTVISGRGHKFIQYSRFLRLVGSQISRPNCLQQFSFAFLGHFVSPFYVIWSICQGNTFSEATILRSVTFSLRQLGAFGFGGTG